MKRKKIRAEFVIGYRDDDHVIFKDGEVVFENNEVIFVGHDYPDPVDEVVDAGHAIVGPGFIDLDALVDIDHGILDVAVPRHPDDHFQVDDQRFRSVDAFDRHFWQVKQRMSIAQLIMNGITTAMPIAGDFFRGWAETYEEFEDFAAIATELGLRMYLGPSYRAYARHRRYAEPDFEKGEKSLQDAFNYAEKFDRTSDGLIRAFLSPCQISYLTEEYLVRSKQFSDSHHIPIRLHACEGMYEVGYLYEQFGKTTIEYLADLGFLGPLTIIPHAIYVNEMIGHGVAPERDELALLASSGTSIIHTPIAEAHGGLALNSFSRYHHAGVNITMGTDTHPADMIQNLNFSWNLTRIFERGEVFNEYTVTPRKLKAVTAADFYRAATTQGAKALGRDDIGQLSPGSKADIIVIDLSSMRIGPVEDPIRTLIMNTTGANVRDVIINGRFVMRDYQIPGLDMERLIKNGQACFDQFRQMYSTYDRYQRPARTFFPDSFPVVERK
jgi:cytosine/adenosine deaminase-related metal-dependent hydrolase